MFYEINVLVNGSRCKQYNHNGKIYIEAKQGSEYVIEVKNNNWQRILAVCSVDGLDILNGKPAVEDAPGYVIPGYMSSKFDGFRLSNEKVAKFVFDYKNTSYAASKGDGSERNVGVIGARLFTEKVKPPVVVHQVNHVHYNNPRWWDQYGSTTGQPYPSTPTIWCDTLGCANDSITSCADDWMNKELERGLMDMDDGSSAEKYCCDNIPTKGATKGSPLRARSAPRTLGLCSMPEPKGFDMGTKFGESKESKVIEVDFEKGTLILPTTNIYYASRQSLIEMGIPLGCEKQVSFPEAFPDKYATPPKGWRG
jgi:hypothetical protein